MTTESLRAFAARKGNAVSYWHGQKARGRLVMVEVNGKPMVDVEASEALLASTADPAKAHMAGVNARQRIAAGHPAPAQPVQVPEFQAGGGAAGTSKNATYLQAKTAREVYEAKNAQLEYEERIGKLIRADAMRAKIAPLAKPYPKSTRVKKQDAGHPPALGGAVPTDTLHTSGAPCP